MTARINFFQERITGLSYRKMTRISVAVLGLLSFLILWQNLRLSLNQKHLKSIQGEIQAFQKASGLYGAAGEPGKIVDPVQAVSHILLNDPSWAEAMSAIPKGLVQGIHLEKIQGQNSPENRDLTLIGTALQANLVPELLDRLRSLNAFSKVKLSSTESTGNQEYPVRFKLSLQMKNGESS